MRTIRAAFDAFAAALELWSAEARTGVTLIDAVALDARLTELRMVGDPTELLAIAVTAGKCGLAAGDIEPMVSVYYAAKMRGITNFDIRSMGDIIMRHQFGREEQA